MHTTALFTVAIVAAPLFGCSQTLPDPQGHVTTRTGGAPHVVGASLGTDTLAVGTDTLTLTFSEPMDPALVTIGDYAGGRSCDEYGAMEAIQVSIDQQPDAPARDARCLGGTISTDDNETYVVKLNSRIGRGDIVWLQVTPNTAVVTTPTSVPIVQPLTDADGVALVTGFSARFEVYVYEFKVLSPVWSDDSDDAYESFEPVEFSREPTTGG